MKEKNSDKDNMTHQTYYHVTHMKLGDMDVSFQGNRSVIQLNLCILNGFD